MARAGFILLCVAVVGCTPNGPPFELRETGFRLLLDTAIEDEDPCRPSLDPTIAFVRAAQQVEGPGPYFVCPGVPITATGQDTRIYVSNFASAIVMGDGTVTWALAGAQVHASGERAVIVAEEQALVSVAQSSSGIQRCPEIVWNDNWNAGCD